MDFTQKMAYLVQGGQKANFDGGIHFDNHK